MGNTTMNAMSNLHLRESEVAATLERICQALELTPTEHALAKSRYESVGDWLAKSDREILRTLVIYPHGSVALGTTTRPHGKLEHDVDLVSHAPAANADLTPSELKREIGDRLRANGNYAPILEEKRRCWRINYANEFHLDITPTIANPQCPNGGELVPDKELRRWKPTHPKGYKLLFDRRAAIQPRLRLMERALVAKDAAIDPFPEQLVLKGMLRRIVQISKRHRDIYFSRLKSDLAPISVVITSLAARSYEQCVTNNVYISELQLILHVIRVMPEFIQMTTTGGRTTWAVWNETTAGENFAEKWNADPARASAFYEWHARLISDIERLVDVSGIDQLTKSLKESFGDRPVETAMTAWHEDVSTARTSRRLSVAGGVGLTTRAGAGTAVRSNTFFGGS
jgi:hypothetical protein